MVVSIRTDSARVNACRGCESGVKFVVWRVRPEVCSVNRTGIRFVEQRTDALNYLVLLYSEYCTHTDVYLAVTHR